VPAVRLIAVLLLSSAAATTALAQGSGGASSGGASSGGASRGGGTTAAPTNPASPPATGAPAAPGSSSAPYSTNPASRPAPGVANTPVDPQRNNVDANPPTQRQPGTAATAPGGSSQAVPQPNTGLASPTARTEPGGASGGGAARTGKNRNVEEYESCLRLWDKGTHMTKSQWSATCRRVQSRLTNLKVDEPKATKAERQRKLQ
jgi:hypothetical protein